MNSRFINALIRRARKKYHQIVFVSCPAFGNELVYFNKHGFNHLIRKGRINRKSSDLRKRLYLIKYAPIIISSDIAFTEYKIIKKPISYNGIMRESNGHFWEFNKVLDENNITVIIRQIDSGKKHFFSIFISKHWVYTSVQAPKGL